MNIEIRSNVFPTHFNDLNCTGEEASVYECAELKGTNYSCPDLNIAGVACQKGNFFQTIKLI